MTDRPHRRDLLIAGLATTATAATPTLAQPTGRFRLALAGDYEDLAVRSSPWNTLPGVEVVAFNTPLTNPAATIRALKDFDGVVLMRERMPMSRAVIDALPRLKLIVFSGLMNATLDHTAAAERNIFVANALGIGNEDEPSEGGGPAELAFALMLACAWHIPQATAMMRGGGWAMQPAIPLKIPLAGRTLGIPGYGGIGARMGKFCQALGMKVLGFSRSLTDEAARADIITKTDLEGIMRQSDVISVHLPLTAQTRGMIGAKEIAMMKPGAIFINTARGPIVDEPALIEALRTRRIAMGGFDVYGIEPLPADHPFTRLPNVIMTPHIGYVSEGGMTSRYKALFEVVKAYREGSAKRYVPTARDNAS